jgi:tetratricopeptide (TPR) repeat protein
MDLEGHCVAACDPHTEIHLDHNDLKGVSEEFRDLFRFNFTAGISELNPMAVARKPELARQFRADRARHLAKITSMIRAGTQRALDIVLNAQPKYAAAQAGSSNHLGARYHIVWALARKPKLLGAFYSESGLAMLYTFLDSLSEIQHFDPGFCARMDMLRTLIYADLEEAWKLLERTPRSVRSHPLFQLRQAMAYAADTDYERALPIYLELCETWPDDAAAFANACDCLIRLGRWAEADVVLNRAPRCYQKFHVYYSQRENLKQQNLACSPPKTVPFRGQPDLGGLLATSQSLKSQPLTCRGKDFSSTSLQIALPPCACRAAYAGYSGALKSPE